MKGFHLSFIIFCDVPTVYCWSSSGDSVESLSRTISTTVIASDWFITNFTHGWQVFHPRRKPFPQRSVVSIGCCDVSSYASALHSTVSVYVVRVKSYLNNPFNPTLVPVRFSVNKLISFGELLSLKPLTLYRLFVFCLDHLRSSHESPCS